MLAGLAVLVALALGVAWMQRIQLAEGFIADELARRGVPARFTVTEIGFFRQRIERVSIGDPANPDLVADWVEVDTGFTLGGPVVTGVRAGPLRMRGRLADGKLSLGALDKLLPPPTGKPVELPRLFVDLADARMALATPYGDFALALKGTGRLDDGFAGRLGAQSARVEVAGCTARRASADVAVRIAAARPSLRGPMRADAVACGEALAWEPAVDLNVALDAALTRWRGQAGVSVASLQSGDAVAESVRGTLGFAGSAARTSGRLDLAAERFALPQGDGEGLALAGSYVAGEGGASFEGTVSSTRAALAPDLRASLAGFGDSGAGTPAAPLIAQFARALDAAAKGGRLEAALSVDGEGARVSRASFVAASGATLVLEGGEGVAIRWPAEVQVNATLTTRGGGLPEAAVQLAQARPGAPVAGSAFVQPYAAGGARLELTTVRFSAAPGGVTRVSTQATLSGPLPGGRVDRLVVPLDARWDGRGLIVNPGCAPVAFARLAASSLVLGASRLTVCPVGGALFALRGESVSGGARVADVRLDGRIGESALSLAAAGGRFDFASQDFALTDVAARIGSDSVTRLDVARLDGRVVDGGARGGFAGAGGQIGTVPLLLSDGAGAWRIADSVLTLDGAMRVSDAAEAPRFLPLTSSDVRLTLADNRIEATGTLVAPKDGSKVADTRIVHDLSTSHGSAVLDVPGIVFAEEGLQPSDLTPLTFGVIAAVKGKVSGEGRVAWTPEAVTSDGVFRTAGTDLAASFGPVTGLSTEVRFSDLLNVQTPPGQVATVALLNPGVPVENGTLRYRLLDSQRVQVEGARWPFAGGVLELDPTVIDFAAVDERRMTFRLTGVDAAQFLQEMEFKNLNATGTFDGVLPMVFDARGGRIEGGHLTAREGGGSIAYIGEVTKRDLGFWGNLAFQALKSLNYRSLEIEMNGSLAGDMVTAIRFAGVSQGAGAKSNFLVRRLQRLPFVFNVTIRAPFRQLLESVQSYYDPRLLIERNLPALIEEQQRRQQQDIQPSESETVP